MMRNTVNSDLLVVNNFGGDLSNLSYLRLTKDVANTLYNKLQLILILIISSRINFKIIL